MTHRCRQKVVQGLWSLCGPKSYSNISWRIRELDSDFSNRLDRKLDSTTAEIPVKLQNEMIITRNLVAPKFHEIMRQDVLPLSE